jgi:hypothetical protein
MTAKDREIALAVGKSRHTEGRDPKTGVPVPKRFTPHPDLGPHRLFFRPSLGKHRGPRTIRTSGDK